MLFSILLGVIFNTCKDFKTLWYLAKMFYSLKYSSCNFVFTYFGGQKAEAFATGFLSF